MSGGVDGAFGKTLLSLALAAQTGPHEHLVVRFRCNLIPEPSGAYLHFGGRLGPLKQCWNTRKSAGSTPSPLSKSAASQSFFFGKRFGP